MDTKWWWALKWREGAIVDRVQASGESLEEMVNIFLSESESRLVLLLGQPKN